MNPDLLKVLVKDAVIKALAEQGEELDAVQLKRRIEEAVILAELEIKGRTQALLAHQAELRANRATDE